MRQAEFGVAVFVSGCVSAAALAVLYAGAILIGTVYAPFAVVDVLARRLPPALVTSSIESIVKMLQLVGVRDLSTAAKTVERVLLFERPLAGHREDDEVVVEAVGASEPMQRVGHEATISRSGDCAGAPRRPRPMLVFARDRS